MAVSARLSSTCKTGLCSLLARMSYRCDMAQSCIERRSSLYIEGILSCSWPCALQLLLIQGSPCHPWGSWLLLLEQVPWCFRMNITPIDRFAWPSASSNSSQFQQSHLWSSIPWVHNLQSVCHNEDNRLVDTRTSAWIFIVWGIQCGLDESILRIGEMSDYY